MLPYLSQILYSNETGEQLFVLSAKKTTVYASFSQLFVQLDSMRRL